MSPNSQVLTSWIAAIDRQDLAQIDRFVADDIVDHHLPPGLPAGRAGVHLWMTLLSDALQMSISIDDMVEQGDRIAVRATISGCHVADFMGLPPSNRPFVAQMMSIERFVDGRIAERWENVDTAAIMGQIAPTA